MRVNHALFRTDRKAHFFWEMYALEIWSTVSCFRLMILSLGLTLGTNAHGSCEETWEVCCLTLDKFLLPNSCSARLEAAPLSCRKHCSIKPISGLKPVVWFRFVGIRTALFQPKVDGRSICIPTDNAAFIGWFMAYDLLGARWPSIFGVGCGTLKCWLTSSCLPLMSSIWPHMANYVPHMTNLSTLIGQILNMQNHRLR